MSIRRALMVSLVLTAVAVILAACPAQPTPDVNAAVQTALAQTRTAEDSVAQAVAATLTASAPTATTEAPTSIPVPTSTATPVQIEIIPAATPPPAPTATPIRIAISPVDGDDGNDFLRGSSDSNAGRNILLPGFDQGAVGTDPTFRDFINFRVEVFDTRAGLYDGAGIQDVTFRIIADDGNGDTVWEKTEASAPYCVFGGDAPDCAPAIDLSAAAQWPNPFAGRVNNNVYLAEIDITPVNGDTTQWRWRFFIDSPQLQPAAQPNTARITSITVQNGRYYVDFETYGFSPQLPGQHVHFFWNTVPPQQAGMPGSGPWQLYPANSGGVNSSPFTMFAVNDRSASATQICILVANNDHSVNQGTGNCVDVP